MSRTSTDRELLHLCLQDLYAGRRLVAERLPEAAAYAGEAVAATIRNIVRDYLPVVHMGEPASRRFREAGIFKFRSVQTASKHHRHLRQGI